MVESNSKSGPADYINFSSDAQNMQLIGSGKLFKSKPFRLVAVRRQGEKNEHV